MGYPKEIYKEAFDILDSRRKKNQEQVSARKMEIREKIPEIAGIERQMAQTASRSIYAVASGQQDVSNLVNSLGEENLRLQGQRAACLEQAGYPADYLAESFECGSCRDTGYLGAQMCRCLEVLLRDIAFSKISGQADLEAHTFDNFSLQFYSGSTDPESGMVPRKHMGDVLAYCKQYADRFSRKSESLLMMGRTGQGKTHLSLAIAGRVIEQGYGVLYASFQKIIDKLEAGKFSYDPQLKERYQQDLSQIMECDLLVLDDLGAEFSTPFSTATAYNIINTRLVEQRPTIINTNMELSAMEKQYSQRIASRLGFSYKVIAFYGEDVRFLKRAGKRPHA